MLKGFGIKGWRGFGVEPQKIGPFTKINVFAGPNNVGKSTILRGIEALHNLRGSGKGVSVEASFRSSTLNSHQGQKEAPIHIYLPLIFTPEDVESLVETLTPQGEGRDAFIRSLKRLVEALATAQGNGGLWFEYDPNGDLSRPVSPSISDLLTQNGRGIKVGLQEDWYRIWTMTSHHTSGSPEHWIPGTLNHLSPIRWVANLPVFQIEVFRKIGEPDSSYEGLNGKGLIQRLAALERPSFERLNDKKQFQAINKFIQEVLENDTARLEIPTDKSAILVEIDGKPLPVDSLGTGIHEVIILAAAATTVSDSIICIEEPEIHLHPRLQKKLIRYLGDKTSNQYFISTHSAHILDADNVSAFHVYQENGETRVSLATTPATRAAICFDLGYRASDLMQANSVIWVEGPSDRVYINYWLHVVAPELKEGADYSIMFYGGRLLSHLSADDSDVDEFISLRRLNRNIAIVIDSDKKSSASGVNATKQRVCEEFAAIGGIAWVTEGKEIENYVDPEVMKMAVKATHKSAVDIPKTGKFDTCYAYQNKHDELVADVIDKVKIARKVRELNPTIDRLDLRSRIDTLVSFIRVSS